MPEGVEGWLRQLTAQTGDDSRQVYAKYAGITVQEGDSLDSLVYRKLAANGKSAQIRESLEETLHAGGAVGESIEECLIRSGLTGWT